MADYDKSAHDMMRFRAGMYAEFESRRFLVAYHEDRLYSVRDEKRGTVTLVEARDPESAYLKASSIRPISTADVAEVVRCKECKYYTEGKLLGPTKFCYFYKIGTGLNTADDDFCSKGERREPILDATKGDSHD